MVGTAKEYLGLFLLKAGATGMALAFWILVGRHASVSLFGEFQYSMTVISSLTFLCGFGVPQAIFQKVLNLNGRRMASAYIFAGWAISIFSLSLCALLILALAVFSWVSSAGFLCVLAGFSICRLFMMEVCRAHGTSLFFYLSEFLQASIRLVAFYAFNTVFDLEASFFGSVILSLAFSSFFLCLRDMGIFGVPSKRFLHRGVELLGVGKFMLLNALSWQIVSWSDFYMLKFLADEEDLGVYAISNRIAMTLLFVVPISAALFPRKIVASFNSSEFRAARSYLYQSWLVGLLFVFVASCTLGLFVDEILAFMGKHEYRHSVHIGVLALTVGYFAQGVLGPLGVIGNGLQLHRKMMTINLFCCVLNLSGNYILIGELGFVGAAVSTSLTLLTMKILQCAIVGKSLKVLPLS